MAEGRVKNTELSAIAAAIRQKNGLSTTYKPAEMAQAILDIPTGGSAVIESKNITANGTYTAPTGVDGYNPVTVDVQPNLQRKTATENGTVTPDSGYDGLSSVVVNVSGGGGGGGSIDYSYLPSSTQANVLASSDNIGLKALSAPGFNLVPSNVPEHGFPMGFGSTVSLGAVNTSATAYCVAKRYGSRSNAVFFVGFPYAHNRGYDPLFDFKGYTEVIYSNFGDGDTTVSGVSAQDYHVYAISVDGPNRKSSFYVDGVLLQSNRTFSNSGSYVIFGKGIDTSSGGSDGYDSDVLIRYAGVVNECEDESTIIANMQTIMNKLGLT